MQKTQRKGKAKAPKIRLPFLEGIRGLAALYVVIGHICTLSDPSTTVGRVSHSPAWLQHVIATFSYGHLAVASFIVISGFCLELSLFAHENGVIKSLKRFYSRRAQRILPPYYACLAVSTYVALSITTYQIGQPFIQYLPVDQAAILSHVLLIHNFSPDWMYKINGVLWSIAIEVQLYVLFPLLVRGLNKGGRLLLLGGTGLLVYGAMVLIPQAPKLYFWYLLLFVAGMIAAHLAFKPTKVGRLPVVGSVFALGCLYGAYFSITKDSPIYVSDMYMGFGIACICYALTGAARGPFYRMLVSRPVVFLGTFSYSLYLMHHPIAQILFANRPRWVSGEVSLFWYFVACLPIILGGCWVFYLLFERPFMPKRAPKLTPEPKAHAPAGLPLRAYRPPDTDSKSNWS